MFKLTVALPNEVAYEGNVEILNVKVSGGQIGILTNHTPLIDMIKPCEITFKDEQGKLQSMAVSGGWLFVWSKEVTVYVSSSEFDYEINLEDAMLEKAKAEKLLLEDTDMDDVTRASTKAALNKAINQINFKTKRK